VTIVFVNDVEVIDLVLLRSKLLQHTDILAGTPCGVDGDIEGGGFVEEKREF
jgi:hypothetical protein